MSPRTLGPTLGLLAFAALAGCASSSIQNDTQAQAPKPRCEGREVATGSNMVKRSACTKVSAAEGEATRERLESMTQRVIDEPRAR